MNEGKTHRATFGHRLSEFIYGTVMGMVAIVSLAGAAPVEWWRASAIIVVDAVVIWMAHAYSQLIGQHAVAGRRLTGRELANTLQNTWPVVTAGMLLCIPLLLAGAGAWPVRLALRIASGLGIAFLAIIGWRVARKESDRWGRTLLYSVLSASLGLFVVAAELLLRH